MGVRRTRARTRAQDGTALPRAEAWRLWMAFTKRGTAFRGTRAHLYRLAQAVESESIVEWNRWRRRNRGVVPKLSGICLDGRELHGIDLSGARLGGASLRRAVLAGADLRGAALREADLWMADLFEVRADGADFSGASLGHARMAKGRFRGARFEPRGFGGVQLESADLSGADLTGAHMRRAELTCADLTDTRLDRADLRQADLDLAVLRGTGLRGARLGGASLWNVFVRRVRVDRRTEQRGLSVRFDWWTSKPGWISFLDTKVDDLRLAQFHDVIGEHGSVAKLIAAGTMSVVLVLGRFTPARKRVLDRLADALRARGKTAVVYDFPGPENRELTDTVRFVASMAAFVVVDLTAPASAPLELQAFVPDLMVPVVPIIARGRRPFAMFADLQRRYFWVLPPVRYASAAELVRYTDSAIVRRAERVAAQIARRRRTAVRRPTALRRAR